MTCTSVVVAKWEPLFLDCASALCDRRRDANEILLHTFNLADMDSHRVHQLDDSKTATERVTVVCPLPSSTWQDEVLTDPVPLHWLGLPSACQSFVPDVSRVYFCFLVHPPKRVGHVRAIESTAPRVRPRRLRSTRHSDWPVKSSTVSP